MEIIQFVHEGLGNSSYVVGIGNGEAVTVDPDRNVDRYIQAAAAKGLQITKVLETHLHADFITGSIEMAERTGARLLVPAGAEARFPHQPLFAGSRLELGESWLEAVASPGHTPEHLSYVLRRGRMPPVLFSGGSLIVGGAARTDLISPQQTGELTRHQHRTVHGAFKHLPDETVLYPTHGGGSFCSTGSADKRTSTLGEERASNPVLSPRDEADFVRWFPSTFPSAPAYFFKLRPLNQAGPKPVADIPFPKGLGAKEFNRLRASALVVDVRPVDEYSNGHIPGSLSIAFRDVFATWLGWLVPIETPLLFVPGETPIKDVVEQSMLVGFEDFVGFLDGGLRAWQEAGRPVARSRFVDAGEAQREINRGALVLDIRERNEFAAGHIEGALNIPLGSLPHEVGKVPVDRTVVTYCGHGERAATAVSVLERAGRRGAQNIRGGFGSWVAAGNQRSR